MKPQEPTPQKPVVLGSTVRIGQDGDSCDGEYQAFEIRSEDAGGGHFYVIKTERWAFDTLGEFIETLRALDACLPKCEQRLTTMTDQ